MATQKLNEKVRHKFFDGCSQMPSLNSLFVHSQKKIGLGRDG